MSKVLLHHRCTVQRKTEVNDRGFVSNTWANNETGVWCKLHEKRAAYQHEQQGEKVQVDGIIYFKRTQDIRPRHNEDDRDRIIMTTPSSPGGTFLVMFVADKGGRAWKRGLLTAFVKRVRQETPT